MAYLDLGISSMQVDAWERGFSYSYDAPLDMRMDTTQELDARDIVNGWDERRLARLFPEYGEERSRARSPARSRSRRARRGRDDPRPGRAIKSAVPVPAQFARRPPGQARVPGDPHRGQRRAGRARPRPSRGVERPGGRRAVRRDLVPFARGPPRQALPGEKARGCICPPELPICVCGHEPEAEFLNSRAIALRKGWQATRAPAPASCASPASSARWRRPDGSLAAVVGPPPQAGAGRPTAHIHSDSPAPRAEARARRRGAPALESGRRRAEAARPPWRRALPPGTGPCRRSSAASRRAGPARWSTASSRARVRRDRVRPPGRRRLLERLLLEMNKGIAATNAKATAVEQENASCAARSRRCRPASGSDPEAVKRGYSCPPPATSATSAAP